MLFVVGVIGSLLVVSVIALVMFFLVLFPGEWLLNLLPLGRPGRFVLIMVRNLRRSLVRTSLTYVATFVLVFIVTMIWSVLYYLDTLTHDQTSNLKVIVTEKFQMQGTLPMAYAGPLSDGAADPNRPGDVHPQDAMTWQFYIGSQNATKMDRDDLLGVIALEPKKLKTIMKEVWDDISVEKARERASQKPEMERKLAEVVAKMEANPQAVVMGFQAATMKKKQIGDRFTLTGINFKGIDLNFEVVGIFPPGRYDEIAVMNREYLNNAVDGYVKTHHEKHPLADRSLNMVWLKVPDQESFSRVAEQIESSSSFSNPAVKCQTLSAEVASVLDGFRSLIWGMRWLLSPSILLTMAIVLAGAISISVRERRQELAVLKVLGFRPMQVLILVLGEAILVGAISGLLSVALSYTVINKGLGDFTPTFLFVPPTAFLWGPGIGALTALAGSLAPAWSACTVKVSEVFARVA